MDAARFDHLVRSLTVPSRRSVLGLALAAPPSALLGRSAVTARKKKHKHKRHHKNKNKKQQPSCERGTKPCGGQCIPSGDCCTADDCGAGESCQNGTCTTECEPQCDGKACGDDGCGGSCGSCRGNDTCQDGQCVCQPNCGGKACGDDGCGGSCGTCRAEAEICQQDQCVCSVEGAPGPGEMCDADADCCPYTAEQICSKGSGFCESFRPVCRSGFGGKCAGNCDCYGDLECHDGSCRCPGDADYAAGGRCCSAGTLICGPVICCLDDQACLCLACGFCD